MLRVDSLQKSFDGFLAVNIARAEVNVRESTTDNLLLISSVLHPAVFLASPSFLLVDRSTSKSGVTIHLLKLRD